MKEYLLHLLFLSMIGMLSCQSTNKEFQYESEEEWKLAFRVLESEVLQNYELGSKQLDSLLKRSETIEPGILNSGLKCLASLNQHEKLFSILENSSAESKQRVCTEDWFKQLPDSERKMALCSKLSLKKEEVTHPQLRDQFLIMYMNDQYMRGRLAEDLKKETSLDVEGNLYTQDPGATDSINREKLKGIIEEFGFPSKEMVGQLGMLSVFLVIQHSDMDKEYQESQLDNLKKAAEKGDVKAQQYGYLYDRVMINAGKKQLYGSQFSTVDRIKGEAILAPVASPYTQVS